MAVAGERQVSYEEMKELGKWFKKVRKDLGVTQEALAKHLGVNRMTLSSWERGLRIPHTDLYYLKMKYKKLMEQFG